MIGPFARFLDDEDCRRLHDATLEILADPGVDVLHEDARRMLASGGASVDGVRVRIPAEMVAASLESAPTEFTLPDRSGGGLLIRNGETYYGTGSDCLYHRDAASGERRRARLDDVEEMAALCQRLPEIDFVMSMGLPEGVPATIDDLAAFVAMLCGTSKPLVIASRGAHFYEVMLKMAGECGEAKSFAIYAMPSPPLMHDREGAEKLLGCAQHEIPVAYLAAPAPGATAPASVAATVVVANAEVLSGLVIHQLARPGAPFVYGANINMMSMREANVRYCAPEGWTMHQAHCDLARHYGLPSFGYAGCSDSNLLDEQWAMELAMTTIMGALSGGTLLHDVGFIEQGMQSSSESIVLGAEIVNYARAFLRTTVLDDEALALGEIRSVGPGGSHLGRRYTRTHHRAFMDPCLMDNKMHGRWVSEGSTTMLQRVRKRTRELLAQERPYAIEPGIRSSLEELLAAAAETAS
jgi:trimethylamine---corrinoid protein Co-methyltransferase